MPEKLTIEQFAQKIKSKYSEYKDMDNTELVNKIVAKYPDYKEQIDFGVKKKDNSGTTSTNGSYSFSNIANAGKQPKEQLAQFLPDKKEVISKIPKASGFFAPNLEKGVAPKKPLPVSRPPVDMDLIHRWEMEDEADGGAGLFAPAVIQTAVNSTEEPKKVAPLGKAFVKGFGSVVSSTLKSIGIAAKQIDVFKEYGGKKAEDLAVFKAGQQIDDWVNDLTGDLSPEEQEMFSVKLLQGVGQMGAFVLGGVGGKILKVSPLVTTGLLGAAASGAPEYEAAIQSGATPEQANKAFWFNTVIGTTEALPIMAAFRKLDKYTGGLATGALAKRLSSTIGGRITNEAAQGIITESAQEAVSQVMSNLVASKTYDAARNVYDGLLESAAIGGIIGGSMNGIAASIRERRKRGGLTKEEDNQLALTQKFAEQKAAEALDPDAKEITTNTSNNKKVKAISKAKTNLESDLVSSNLPDETKAVILAKVAALNEQLNAAKTEVYQQELDGNTAMIIQSEIDKNEALLTDNTLTEETKAIIQKSIDADKEKLTKLNLPPEQILKDKGEQPLSLMDAERRFSEGERVFGFHEQGGEPIEITSVETLRNFAPDQLLLLPNNKIENNATIQEQSPTSLGTQQSRPESPRREESGSGVGQRNEGEKITEPGKEEIDNLNDEDFAIEYFNKAIYKWWSDTDLTNPEKAKEFLESLKKQYKNEAVTKNISDLFDKATAKDGDNTKRSTKISDITSEEAQRLKDATGLDVVGYTHTIDNYAIKHTLSQHGDEAEAFRGQIPVTKEDFLKIPEILSNPDKIAPSEKNSIGRDVIVYSKKFNGTTYYVEEVRNNKKELSTQTIYKTKSNEVLPPESNQPQTSETFANAKVQQSDNINQETPISKDQQAELDEVKAEFKSNHSIKLITPKQLVSAQDPFVFKQTHENIKSRYKKLKLLIDCI